MSATMENSSSTILFVDNTDTGQRMPVTSVRANAGRSSTKSVDNSYRSNEETGEFANSQNAAVNESSQDFSNTLEQKISEQKAQGNQNQAQPDSQNEVSDGVDKPQDTAEQLQQGVSEPVGQSKSVAVTGGELKAGDGLVQLLAEPNAEKSAAVIVLDVKAAEIKTPKVVGSEKGLLEIKTVLPGDLKEQPGLKNTLPQDTTVQNEVKTVLADIADVSSQPAKLETPLTQGTDAGKSQVLNKTVVSKNSLTGAENAEKPTSEAAGNASGKTAAGEKVPVADVLSVAEKQVEQKTSVLDSTISIAPAKNTTAEQPVNSSQTLSAESGGSVFKSVESGKGKADTQPQENEQLFHESSGKDNKGPEGSFAGEVINKGLKLEEVQAATTNPGTAKSNTGVNSSNGSESNSSEFAQIISGDDNQTSATAQSTKSNSNILPEDFSTNIKEQIQQSISSTIKKGDNQVTIRLNPPELGRVSIKFQERDGQLTGLLEVDRVKTRYEIEHSLPEIIRNLTNSGVQIRRVEVVLTEQSNQQPFKEPSSMTSGQNGQTETGHQGSANTGNGSNQKDDWDGNYDWLRNGEPYSGFDEARWQVSEDSINMLV